MLKDLVQFLMGMSSAASATEKVSGLEHLLIVDESHGIKDIENQLPQRVRFRTTTRTDSFDDFTFVAKKVVSAVTYINAKDMCATSFFNLGTAQEPGHGDWTAHLQMDKTPEYMMLQSFIDQKRDQKTLAEFLEDWNHLLKVGLDGDGGYLSVAINAVRNISIKSQKTTDHSVQDFSAEKSDIEKIEARRKDGEALPQGFIFRCAPYHGLQERDIQLRMSVNTDHQNPQITLRLVRPNTLEMEIANEFKEKLKAALGDQEVIIGSLALK